MGQVAVSESELQLKYRVIPWEDVKLLKVEEGKLVVKSKKGWIKWGSVDLHGIENVFVFFGILIHLGQMNRKDFESMQGSLVASIYSPNLQT